MKSVLEGRPALIRDVEKIAEVAGYLWQNGWAERNGGNITVNVTEMIDDEVRAMPAISDAMTESSPIVPCIQVSTVTIWGVCPSSVIVTRLDLKHSPRMNVSI